MRKMKDSGIAWIGKIPQEWEICKVKNCYTWHKNIVGDNANKFDRLALTLNGVIKRSKDDNIGLQPEEFNGYQILRQDELVFKLIDLENVSTSRVGLSKFDGIVSPAYIVLHKKEKILTKFGYYYFHSLWKREIFNHIGDDGVRSNLSSNDLLSLPYALPPLPEQQAIADKLDKVCGEIDKVIAKTKAVVEEYKKLKQAIITEAVTGKKQCVVRNSQCGIKEKRPMKDSGIAWIGEIPQEWEVKRIGYLYEQRLQKVSDEEYEPLSVTKQGIFPQLEHIAKSDAHDDRKLVCKFDFVINSRSDRRGSCGISNYDGSVSLINMVLVPRSEFSYYYCGWLFKSSCFADEFYKWGHGIVADLWTTNWQDMKKINVCLPPLPEQQAIVAYLDSKCGAIDEVIAKKQQLITEMENYKKSVIYEYVTGKKEVE